MAKGHDRTSIYPGVLRSVEKQNRQRIMSKKVSGLLGDDIEDTGNIQTGGNGPRDLCQGCRARALPAVHGGHAYIASFVHVRLSFSKTPMPSPYLIVLAIRVSSSEMPGQAFSRRIRTLF